MNESLLTEVGTRLGRPVYTWAPATWLILDEFAHRNTVIPVERRYAQENTRVGFPPQMHYDLAALPEDTRLGLRDLAESFYAMGPLDGGCVFLTGMTCLLGGQTAALFAALAASLRELVHESVAVNVPIRRSGESDGTFDLHADLFRQRLLFNVYEKPSLDSGNSLLIPQRDFLDVVDGFLSPREVDWLDETFNYRTWSSTRWDDMFTMCWRQPHSKALRAAMEAAAKSIKVHLGPGEGYFVLDGEWLHGRDFISLPDAGPNRMHRLTFDNAELFANRPEIADELDRRLVNDRL